MEMRLNSRPPGSCRLVCAPGDDRARGIHRESAGDRERCRDFREYGPLASPGVVHLFCRNGTVGASSDSWSKSCEIRLPVPSGSLPKALADVEDPIS